MASWQNRLIGSHPYYKYPGPDALCKILVDVNKGIPKKLVINLGGLKSSWNYHPYLGEVIQFDLHTLFRWVVKNHQLVILESIILDRDLMNSLALGSRKLP